MRHFLLLLGMLILALWLGWFISAPTVQTALADSIRADTTTARTQAAWAMEFERQVAPGARLAWQIFYLSLSLSSAFAFFGLVGVGLLWLMRQASLIRPTATGQFPLVRVGGWGWGGVIDPNKMPGVIVLAAPVQLGALPQVSLPLALSEAGTVQLAAQATALAMTANATRGDTVRREAPVRQMLAAASPPLALPLPTVEQIDPAHIDRLLELTEGAEE